MVRLSSGAVLILAVVGCVWLLPTWVLLLVAAGILVLALVEYGRLARSLGLRVPLAVRLERFERALCRIARDHRSVLLRDLPGLW